MIPEIHTEDQAIILKKFEKQILQLFEVFDHAGNKTIDVREIPTVLCSLGCVPTKAETEEIIKNIQEPDSRGNIHISKFLPFVSNLILKYKFHPAPAEELLRAFQILDKNNVGFLTNDFLTKIMTERGEQFSQEEMKEMTSVAANSDTGDVFYEIYINHIMILSRTKPAAEEEYFNASAIHSKRLPSLYDFVDRRDYTGALNLLEFEQSIGKHDDQTKMWIGYCAFHLGDYKRARSIYDSFQQENKQNPPKDSLLFLACCYFFLGMYIQVDKMLERIPYSRLKIRLQFHLAHKLGDENKLMECHKQLADVIEDQLSLASIHYLRAHYQEAIDIYKRILLDNREFLALNVYIAFCYYKLDYYDVSQDVLTIYLQKYSDSVIATNLKACNYFRLYNGKVAEAEIKTLLDQNTVNSFSFGQDLLRHNLVVFRNGELALQILPPLVDVVPEARLNLVIYYLKQNDYQEAFELIKDIEPSVPHEYILKAVVHAAYGQSHKLRENIKIAQNFFQLVGSSSSECDTIPGRQCMASSYFLQREFAEVQLYLSSIKSYYFNDDCFNFNYAQTKAALGYYKEAEEIFVLIQNERILNDFIYISHLARCFIMNKKPQSAWELYLKMETSAESFNLLQLIANDCYRMAQFWHAAKAFDMLERLDPLPEYWEGKRGACIGVLQLMIAGRQARDSLSDMMQLLQHSANAQVEPIIRVIRRWAKDNRINI